MKFEDEFRKNVRSRLEERQQAEALLAESIKADAEQVEQLGDKIGDALEGGKADAGNAVDALNQNYLIEQIVQNQLALDDLRDTPLYSIEEYEEECKKVRSEYMGRSRAIKARLVEKLEEALLVMDEADGLRKEGNALVRELRQACADAGMDVRAKFKNSAYNTNSIGRYILVGEDEYRKTLNNIIGRLKK